MLSKIKTLAAILKAESFSVASISADAGVPETSVRTVINRQPPNWFETKPSVNVRRGGRAIDYTLTVAGRQGIANALGGLPAFAPVAPGSMPGEQEVPLGITAAGAELLQLPDSPEELRRLLGRVEANLAWAEAELNGSSPPPEARTYRKQIQTFRERVAQLRSTVEEPEQPLRIDMAAAPTVWADSVRIREWSTERPAAGIASHLARIARNPGIAHVVRVDRPSHIVVSGHRVPDSLSNKMQVHVGTLTSDPISKRLASYVKGSLDMALKLIIPEEINMAIDVEMFEGKVAFKKVSAHPDRASQTIRAVSMPGVFICINSKAAFRDLEESLSRIVQVHKPGRSLVILDNGSSPRFAEFAERNSFTYRPLASADLTEYIGSIVQYDGSTAI